MPDEVEDVVEIGGSKGENGRGSERGPASWPFSLSHSGRPAECPAHGPVRQLTRSLLFVNMCRESARRA